MNRIVREPLTDGARRAPRSRLQRYYAAECTQQRMNFSANSRFLVIKDNAARQKRDRSLKF
jgi:hypothetical protein